ncbi:SDR family NAD(P)-dependent oxidoreductase [Ascidiimonas sp. W6]|uniref:SDR family NAD(P)-dependent oxidoreductase n=1 Tax=Ascidiimonas meishanensis TaxID=3128903 RepID=UPI0030EF1490
MSKNSIAIIGIGCRFPDAKDEYEFFDNICKGVNSVKEVTPNRWDINKVFNTDIKNRNKSISKWCAMLEDIEGFDNRFFNLSPKEVFQMDPEQRILLECAYHSIENAGLPFKKLKEEKTSVFIGAYAQDFLHSSTVNHAEVNSYSGIGTFKCMHANRISHVFGLTGKSLTIDTACASSMVAIHEACQSLISKESEFSIAGGVGLAYSPWHHMVFSEARMLSPDGQCKTFDKDANGFVPGEGAGLLILQRLEDAILENNQIYGVIKGSAVNHVGSTRSITAPDAKIQAGLINSVYQKANVKTDTISFIEAHGTGTSLGDPIEVEALTTAFRKDTETTQFCHIGSVKTNIGHLEAASGIAGIIKVLMMMRYQKIPPSININTVNPLIDFENSPFKISDSLQNWESGSNYNLRRAGVTSLGMGGVNSHLLIEEFPNKNNNDGGQDRDHVFMLSAKTENSLIGILNKWDEFIKKPDIATYTLDDICATLAQREHYKFRFGVVLSNEQQLVEAIKHRKELQLPEEYQKIALKISEFSWNGYDEIKPLCDKFPQLKEKIASFKNYFTNFLGINTFSFQFEQKKWKKNKKIFSFITAYSYLKLLEEWGFYPDIVTADKDGVYLAAVYSGMISVKDALLLLKNKKQLERLNMQRPRISFLDQSSDQIIMPYAYSVDFVKRLIQVQKLDASTVNLLLNKAVTLIENQYTFKKFIEEWDTYLEAYNLDVKTMISSAVSLDWENTVTTKELLLTILIANNSINRLNDRWKLSNKFKINNKEYEQLLFLIKSGSISKENLINICLSDDANWSEIAASISKKQEKENFEGVKQHFSKNYFPEIKNPLEWIHTYAQEITHVDWPVDKVSIIDFNQNGNLDSIHTVIQPPSCKKEVYADILKLYMLGINMRWEKVYDSKFNKLALPTYFFERKKFPINKSQDFSSIAADQTQISTSLNNDNGLVYCPDWEISTDINTFQGNKNVLVLSKEKDILKQAELYFEDSLKTDNSTSLIKLTYKELLDYSFLESEIPDQILIISSNKNNSQSLDNVLDQSIKTAFEILNEFVLNKSKKPVEILFIVPSKNTKDTPFYTALSAFGKTINLENPKLFVRTVCIEQENIQQEVFACIWKELQYHIGFKHSVVYRNQIRYNRKRVIKKLTASSISLNNGTYLITGGFGGLGLLLAQNFFPKKSSINVILVGRSLLAKDQEEFLQTLTSNLLNVTYKRADISDEKEVAQLLHNIRKEFGLLRGVFHGAGVLQDSFFTQKRVQDIQKVLEPKVQGTIYLDKYTKEDTLDFFVCFSSVVAEFGNSGQCDYAYANSFMDNFIIQREQLEKEGKRRGKSYSINWPLWEQGGMKVIGQGSIFNDKTGLKAMPTKEGVQILETILQQPSGQYMYCYGDVEKIKDFIEKEEEPSKSNFPIAKEIENISIEQVKQVLTEIFSEILELSIEELEDHTNFEEYGIDSIMINQFNIRLEKKIGQVSKTLLYEYHTINELSEYLFNENKNAFQYLLKEPSQNTKNKEGAVKEKEFEVNKIFTQEEQSDDRTTKNVQSDIAIIGVSGRYPKAPNLDIFWKNLEEGKDCVIEIPKERWDFEKEYEASEGKSYCAWGGFLEDADKFDPLFFRISPNEAELMDPQERIFLETAWHTIEDAKYTPEQLSGKNEDGSIKKVGVFAGVTTLTHSLWGPEAWRQGNRSVPKDLPWSIANRVSYTLGFEGPSMAVDTACASSLTAIHLACESIKNRECTTAIAGGVNLYLHPSKYEWLCHMNMLSKKGRCHTFGDQADGFVPGEGVGAILLKPLEEAKRDGDYIYAVIKGTSVNHGGHTHGYTVPNPNAQTDLIVEAIKKAKIDPSEITYFEAHGTGTSLGDPIEISGLDNALKTALGKTNYQEGKKYATVGSVKSNIGHLEAAAGIAGVTKILLQMKHKTLVPSIHSQNLNPKIDFEGSCYTVQKEKTPWNTEKAVAGISSFGAGGANAHAILCEYKNFALTPREHGYPLLFIMSAKNKEQLIVYIKSMIEFVKNSSDSLVDIIYSLQVSRTDMEERIAFMTNDKDSLVRQLSLFVEQDSNAPKSNHIKTGVGLKDILYTKEALNTALSNKDWKQIAYFWLHGVKINWGELVVTTGNRIRLPLYPFSRERYWFKDQISSVLDTKTVVKEDRIHPLIHSNVSEPTIVKFESELLSAEFYLDDHFVINQPILPAVAYIEMARVAVAQATGKKVVKINNNAWPNPIIGNKERIKVETVLKETPKGWGYEISANGKICGQGIVVLQNEDEKSVSEVIDTASIKSRCKDSVAPSDFYQKIIHKGLKLGKSFQLLQEINFGEVEALSYIELSKHLEHEYEAYCLHPALMDSALQTLLGLLDRHGLLKTLNIPFSINQVEILSPSIPKKCITYVKMVHGAVSSLKKFQITLLDLEGNVLVKIKDLIPRPFIKPPMETPNFHTNLLLTPVWQETSVAVINSPAPKRVLLFDESIQLKQELLSHLNNSYIGETKIVLVKKGTDFKRTDAYNYIINHKNPDDYGRLIDHLKSDDLIPEKIVHCWSNQSPDCDLALSNGFYPALFLLQNILVFNRKKRIKWIWVYESTSKESNPYGAAFYGLSKAISKEYSNQHFKTLGIDNHTKRGAVIAAELRNEEKEVWDVRYANHQRLERKWEQMDTSLLVSSQINLKNNGIILITGGAGAIGLKVAEWIANENSNHIVLLGRSILSKEKQDQIAFMNAKNSSFIEYIQTDVSDKKQIEEVFKSLKQTSKIQGVIHSAGVLRDAYLPNKEQADCESVFETKIKGLNVLDEILASEPLEFFLLFSAAAAILGNAGQSDYAYANSYMDAFATRRNGEVANGTRFGKTTTINWSLWENGGMGLEENTIALMERTLGITPMSDHSAKRIVAYALTTDKDQIAYIEGYTAKLSKYIELAAPIPVNEKQEITKQEVEIEKVHKSMSEQETITPDPDEINNLFQQALLSLVSSIIKLDVEKINIKNEFSAYGFDSVSFTKLTNQLNETFDLDITPAVFFEYQTIASLVEHVMEEHEETLNKFYKKKLEIPNLEAKENSILSSTSNETINYDKFLQETLIKQVSTILKLDENRINVKSSLSDYGFDSIKFTELANELNNTFSLDLTPAIFFEYASIIEVQQHLIEEYKDLLRSYFVANNTDKTISEEKIKINGSAPSISNIPVATKISNPSFTEQNRIDEVDKDAIAIIGMAAKLPQSSSLDEFWENILNEKDLITEIPKSRWDWEKYYGDPQKEPNKTNIKWGGFIKEDAGWFDASFFGISPREAALMDPQQRYFLQIVYQTIEDAGYKPSDLVDSKTGMYVGVSAHDYYDLMQEQKLDIEAYTTTGYFHSILANRVSYLLNLQGPSFPIDTACSSSLVAIRSAIESIRTGGCEMAVVGAVSLLLSPTIFISFNRAGMLSQDGRCKTFDESANGYVRGEGIGAVLLKPLHKAIADRDNIQGIIRGSSVNHGGKVNTMTSPNPNAQSELIKMAFKEGNIDPSTVSYMEAHGTGTSLGDPIEVNGLKKAFKDLYKEKGISLPKNPTCGIGSVKTNIGHLETCAGLAGIFKALLAMKHEKLPGTLHINTINPYLKLEGSPFYIVQKTQDWERLKDENNNDIPRRAGVSSFGFGGTNAHVLLEEFNWKDDQRTTKTLEPTLFVLSAKTKEQLRVYVRDYIDFLEKRKKSTQPLDEASTAAFNKNIREKIAKYIGVVADDINPDDTLEDLGIDLIHFEYLINDLKKNENMVIDNSILDNTISIKKLTIQISDKLSQKEITKDVTPSLNEITYTLQVGRAELDERLAIITSTDDELLASLYAYSSKDPQSSVYEGSVDMDLPTMFSDKELEEITLLTEEKRLEELARFWVRGASIDWTKLYKTKKPIKVSIPTYPFAKIRHWLPTPKKKEQPLPSTSSHPLLNRLVTEDSLKDGLVFETILKKSDAIVMDHHVAGNPVLPGVAYLEMARAALNYLGEEKKYLVTNVVWLKTLKLAEDTKVYIKLNKQKGVYAFEIYTLHSNQNIVYCQGNFVDQKKSVSQHFNVEAIKVKASKKLEQSKVYDEFERIHLQYGNYYRGIKEVLIGKKEALASIDVAAIDMQEINTLVWHPTVMDAALQTIATLEMPYQIPKTRLPYYVEKIEHYKSLDNVAYVYVRTDDSDKFEVHLLNLQGKSVLYLLGVRIRKLEENTDLSKFFYTPQWFKAPLKKDFAANISSKNTLIVYAEHEEFIAKELLGKLRKQTPFLIKIGTKNQRINTNHQEVNYNTPEALNDFLQHISNLGEVYFLGKSRSKDLMATSSGEFIQQQEEGIYFFFKLIKALGQFNQIQEIKQIKILVHNTQSGVGNTTIDPVNSDLIGFSKTLAKEYKHIGVSCITLCAAQSELNASEFLAEVCNQLILEPPHKKGEEIVYYQGHRLIKKIKEITLESPEQSKFRQGGVYLIIGGVGGIGFALSKYLSEKYKAKIVLTGRRQQNQEITSKIQEIESLGGEALYSAADISDIKSTKEVIEKAKHAFSTIHGIIHSAIILEDKIIERMETDDLQKVLAPKGIGSFNLFKAIENEILDFVLFFSSVQSFTGSLGQSSYAAASTLKDSIGMAIGQYPTMNAKIINWGYWGSVGIVSGEKYKNSIKAQGYESIQVTQGIEAIERALASTYKQIIAIKSNDKVLQEIGLVTTNDSWKQNHLQVKSIQELLPEVSLMPQAIAFDKGLRNLEKYGWFLLLKTFQKMGVFKQAGEKYFIKDLIAGLQVQDEYKNLFLNVLKMLNRAKFIKANKDQLITTKQIDNPSVKKILVALESKEEEFIRQFPFLKPFIRLQTTCIKHYPEILTGKMLATDIIFPNASMDLVKDVYKNNPLADYSNENVGKAIKVFIEDKIPRLKKNEKIKILEIGAGTGGTTENILKVIQEYHQYITYVYSDISPRFLAYGKENYEPTYSFLEFNLLDIEKPIESQGFEESDFDLIIGANVLHATNDIQYTLGNVNFLLKNNGWLVLNEATTLMEFHSLVFGLLKGWWLHKNDSTRITGSPLLTLNSWKDHLLKQGFEELTTLGKAPNDLYLVHNVIIGKKSNAIIKEKIIHQKNMSHV